jgi:chaperonin GroEL (HSP60 family)
LPVLEMIARENRPLVVVAEDVEGQALAAMIMNAMRGTLKVQLSRRLCMAKSVEISWMIWRHLSWRYIYNARKRYEAADVQMTIWAQQSRLKATNIIPRLLEEVAIMKQ